MPKDRTTERRMGAKIAALMVLAIATIAPSLYFYRGIVDYRPPFPQMPDETALRRNGPRLARSVLIVVVDGLRLDVSYNMTTLNLLRAQGADAISLVGLPSLSFPGDAVLFTGAWQEFSGVTTNWYTGPGPDSVFDEAKRSNLTTVTIGYGSLNMMFGRSIDNELDYEAWIDSSVLSQCLSLIKDGHFDLMAVHFESPDPAGHQYGGTSSQYREAAAKIDGYISEILQHLNLSESVIIITSDHGHRDEGGHGGGEREVVETPLIIAGSHVRNAILGTVNQTDIAPTISVILGMPIPLLCQGQPLIQALDIDVMAQNQVLELNAYQKSNLYAKYRIFLGLDQRTLDPANAGNLSALMGEVKGAREERLALERERRLPWAVIFCILPLVYLCRHLRKLTIPFLGLSLYLVCEAIIFKVDGKTLTLSAFNSESSVIAIPFRFILEVMAVLFLVCALISFSSHIRRADENYAGDRLVDTVILIFEAMLIQMAYFIYANPIGVSWALPDIVASFNFFLKSIEASTVVLTSPLYIWVARLLSTRGFHSASTASTESNRLPRDPVKERP